MKVIEDRCGINKGVEPFIDCDIKPYICNGVCDFDTPCNSTLLVSPEDIFERHDIGLDLSLELHYSFKCPICGAYTDINIRSYSEKAQKTIIGASYTKCISRNK